MFPEVGIVYTSFQETQSAIMRGTTYYWRLFFLVIDPRIFFLLSWMESLSDSSAFSLITAINVLLSFLLGQGTVLPFESGRWLGFKIGFHCVRGRLLKSVIMVEVQWQSHIFLSSEYSVSLAEILLVINRIAFPFFTVSFFLLPLVI